MKKIVSMLMALVMVLGIGCALAENHGTLPPYTFNAGQEDPVLGAVVNYMLTMDSGVTVEEGGVLIPTPIIVKTKPKPRSGGTSGSSPTPGTSRTERSWTRNPRPNAPA